MAQADIRNVALDVIIQILEKDGYTHLLLRQVSDKYGYWDRHDRALLSRIVIGTVERAISLDYVINQFSTIKTNKMKPLIRNLLRLSVYQIIYMDRINVAVACNEAVRIAKLRGFSNLSKFVNGVLRSISRTPEKWNVNSDITLKYSMPSWIVEKLKEQYKDQYEQILAGYFQHENKGTCMRVNTSKASVKEVMDSIYTDYQRMYGEATGKDICVVHPYGLNGLYLHAFCAIDELTAFKNGSLVVQDMGSILAGTIADARPGYYCIDVCAAPGGKSIHLADSMKNEGLVVSRDVSESKEALIYENVNRCQFTCVEPQVLDATVLSANDIGKYDLVFADLPCSGMGMIGTKPDIKYKLSENKLDELVLLQRHILEVVTQYLKPAGHLLYSTCTLNKQENEEMVHWMMKQFDLELEDITDYVPDALKTTVCEKGMLTLLPGIHESEGFFIAKLKKADKVK